MTVAEYVIKFIADKGVRHIFTVSGGGVMHLDAAMAREPRITPICSSHEQASAMAAEAYGKVTGMGVVVVTTGPGATNVITGVVGGWLDSTPMLIISGQVKEKDNKFGTRLRQKGPQEVDVLNMAKGVAKYAATLLEPSTTNLAMKWAWETATEGRKGPVWIEIPIDVQGMEIA